MLIPRLLATALAWIVAVPATAVLSLATVAVTAIRPLRRHAFALLRVWARLCLWAARCPLEVTGQLPAPEDGPLVIMANHQSALDIPVMLAVIPSSWRATVWAKRSLFRVPFLGWSMRAVGMMPIDRVQRSTAARVFAASLGLLREGRSVLVFPEETYGPGDELLPLQRGGFLMAVKAGASVLPVRVRGTRDVLPPGRRLLRPGAISVRIGPLLHTRGGGLSLLEALVERTGRHLEPSSGDEAEPVTPPPRRG